MLTRGVILGILIPTTWLRISIHLMFLCLGHPRNLDDCISVSSEDTQVRSTWLRELCDSMTMSLHPFILDCFFLRTTEPEGEICM
jgi:hypothetical protein